MTQSNDRHLTTEQLSVYLDTQDALVQIGEDEQKHVQECMHCQHELETYRKTIGILHTLPQPELPRSFTLSVEKPPVITAIARRPFSTRAFQSRIPQRSAIAGKQQALATTLRIVSTLVAAVGLMFVLSGLLTLYGTGGTTNQSSATNSEQSPYGSVSRPPKDSALITPATDKTSQSMAASTATNHAEEHQPAQSTAQATPQNAISNASQENATNTNSSRSNSSSPNMLSTIAFFDLVTPAGKMAFGILLCVVGGMGFRLFKQRKKVSASV